MMGRMTGKSKVSRSTLPLDLISHIFVFCKYFFEEYKKTSCNYSIDRLLWDSLLSLNSQSEIRHIYLCAVRKEILLPGFPGFSQHIHRSFFVNRHNIYPFLSNMLAVAIPLIKKSSLDPSNLTNFCRLKPLDLCYSKYWRKLCFASYTPTS